MKQIVWLLLLIPALAFGQVEIPGPRALSETFLQAAQSQDLELAKSCFEPAPGAQVYSRQSMLDLAYLLQRMKLDPASLPDRLEEKGFLLNRIVDDSGREIGTLRMVRLDSGQWAFSAATLRQLRSMATHERALQAKVEKEIGKESETGPEGQRTPREAMQTYFAAMDAGAPERTAALMDLGAYPLVSRPSAARRLAWMMLAVLNRTEYLVLDAIPDSPEASVVEILRVNRPDGIEAGTMRLARGADGGWRFNRETLASLPLMWDAVKNRPTLAGQAVVDEEMFRPEARLRSMAPAGWRIPIGFGVELWQLLFLAFGGLACWLAATLFVAVTRWILGPWRRRQTEEVTLILPRVGRSFVFLAAFFLLVRLVPEIGLTSGLEAFLITTFSLADGAALVWFLWQVWDLVCTLAAPRLESKSLKRRNLVLPILQKIGQLLIVIAVLFYLGSQFGLNVTGLIAGLGIGGAILALAAKDSVENLFGAFTVLFEAPFEIGDWIKVNDIEGTVEDITLRSTKIRTGADTLITLPNGRLITAAIENFGRRRARRFKTMPVLAAHVSADGAVRYCQLVREKLAARQDLEEAKTEATLFETTEAGIRVQILCYILTDSYKEELAIREDIMKDILQAAREAEVEFSAPMGAAK